MTRQVARKADDETFMFKEKDAQESPDKRVLSKEFYLERQETGLLVIKLTAGGEVPDKLKGSWTNIRRAQDAIDNHLATKAQTAAG